MLKSGLLATVLGVGWLAVASSAGAQYIHVQMHEGRNQIGRYQKMLDY